MARELKVPMLEMDLEEVGINQWLVEEGAEVKKGDPLLEIETDKTSFEIEAPEDGVIQGIRASEGDTVPVGAVLAYITAQGEEAPEGSSGSSDSSDSGEQPTGNNGRKDLQREMPVTDAIRPISGDAPSANGRHLRASPAARRASSELGVDIEGVSGSGPNGRIYLSDVRQAAENQDAAEPPAPEEESQKEQPAPSETVRREPLSRVRQIGAARTAKSFSEAPHFYLNRDIEVDRLMDLRQRLSGKIEPAPSVTELLALAASRVLRDHQRLNARYADGELELNSRVNLGMAVATDEGLVVPVLKGADTLPLRELTLASKDLVRRARENELRPEELSGGTFTISNLGMMDIDSFNAIINSPETAILAVGKVRVVPDWDGEQWLPRRKMSCTLSVDHRVADGADGARFLKDLQDSLSDWEMLL